VARIYGYDRLPSTLPADVLPPQRTNWDLVREERVRDILVGAGLQEVITYPLLSIEREAALDATGEAPVDPDTYITLLNPISPQRSALRHTLLASLLEVVASNLRFRDRVKVFEVGRVYLPVEGQELPEEPRRLGIAMTGPRRPEGWLNGSAELMDFFDLKGVVEVLLERLHIADARFEATTHPALHPGRTAVLLVQGRSLGVLGEVHPVVRERFDLPEQPVMVAEIDLEALLQHVREEELYQTISRYPVVEQDIAVVVDEEVPAARVRDLILEAGGELLRRAVLFDVYRGPQIPEGKKSLAYSLTYQAMDRTLTDEEVAQVQARIVQRLEEEIGARLRGGEPR
jgi:phenylalanyl-tRNA synthetase beta chain